MVSGILFLRILTIIDTIQLNGSILLMRLTEISDVKVVKVKNPWGHTPIVSFHPIDYEAVIANTVMVRIMNLNKP